MPIRPCPSCAALGPRHLDWSSRDGHVDYYRCDVCGHVWSITKDATQEIRHVTRLMARPTPQRATD